MLLPVFGRLPMRICSEWTVSEQYTRMGSVHRCCENFTEGWRERERVGSDSERGKQCFKHCACQAQSPQRSPQSPHGISYSPIPWAALVTRRLTSNQSLHVLSFRSSRTSTHCTFSPLDTGLIKQLSPPAAFWVSDVRMHSLARPRGTLIAAEHRVKLVRK